MPLIVDAHADIAYNMLKYGRDYTRSAAETRRLEAGTQTIVDNEDTLLGWDDYQRGQVAVIRGNPPLLVNSSPDLAEGFTKTLNGINRHRELF